MASFAPLQTQVMSVVNAVHQVVFDVRLIHFLPVGRLIGLAEEWPKLIHSVALA